VRVAAADAVIDLPAFEGGFAAIEAEFVFRLGAHAPADKYDWTNAEAAELIGALHVGIESAGSPFAEINDHGPAVTASDFGNNAGLIVGPAIDWRADAFERLTAETFIDGVSVGRGDASLIHGSPLAALAFVLGETAARGMPLRAGHWISTGAVTGVHPIHIGQSARAVFGAGLALNCRVVRAGPRQSPQASTRRTSL
jgi:2-keto-4-pentenoate hydratase